MNDKKTERNGQCAYTHALLSSMVADSLTAIFDLLCLPERTRTLIHKLNTYLVSYRTFALIF